jgi:hypothetical protein
LVVGAGLLLDGFEFRDATVPLFICASAISSWQEKMKGRLMSVDWANAHSFGVRASFTARAKRV